MKMTTSNKSEEVKVDDKINYVFWDNKTNHNEMFKIIETNQEQLSQQAGLANAHSLKFEFRVSQWA